MKYNKLVRDKIPEIIKENGKIPKTRTLNNEEYWEALQNKLQEEVSEFLENPTNNEEIADIIEVLYAVLDFKKTTMNEIEVIRLNKKEKRGGFNDRILLEEV